MLTPQRSFILQIDTEADLRAGKIFGQVEHVPSGEVRRFKSLAGLLEALDPSSWKHARKTRSVGGDNP